MAACAAVGVGAFAVVAGAFVVGYASTARALGESEGSADVAILWQYLINALYTAKDCGKVTRGCTSEQFLQLAEEPRISSDAGLPAVVPHGITGRLIT